MVVSLWSAADNGAMFVFRWVLAHHVWCAMNYTACGYKNYTKQEMFETGGAMARQHNVCLKDIWYSVKHKVFVVTYVSGDAQTTALIDPHHFEVVHHSLKKEPT